MSQPKRYGTTSHEWLGDIFTEKPDGEYVLHSDYAALAAENERLKAEVEWLRKADRLVCWNPATEQWELRLEPTKS